MNQMKCLLLVAFSFWMIDLAAQIHEEPEPRRPLKLVHAEPLYIDLIRDLGAHRGEREWNLGWGVVDRGPYNSQEFLVEYEWAVRDRWGLEIELPVTFYTPSSFAGENGSSSYRLPSHRIESLKLATQYTFSVSERWQSSLAVGGILELELVDLDRLGRAGLFQGMLYNPFLVAAKRWGDKWHSLIYTGPRLTQHFEKNTWDAGFEFNLNVHYLLPGERHFAGVEFNHRWEEGRLELVARPQVRIELSEQLLLGLAPGIPVRGARQERMSFFTRLIYEPAHRPAKKNR